MLKIESPESALTAEDIDTSLKNNSDLVDRLASGDEHALASILESALGVEVVSFEKI